MRKFASWLVVYVFIFCSIVVRADTKGFPEIERMCELSRSRYVTLFRDQLSVLSKRDDLRVYFDCRFRQVFVRYLAEANSSVEGRSVVAETLASGPEFLKFRFVHPNRLYLSFSQLENPIIHDESGYLDLNLNIKYLLEISLKGARPRWDPVHRVLTSKVRRQVEIGGDDVELARSIEVVKRNQLTLKHEFNYYDPYASGLGKAALSLQPYATRLVRGVMTYQLRPYAALYTELARLNRSTQSYRESSLTPSRDERYCSDMLSSPSSFSSKRQ